MLDVQLHRGAGADRRLTGSGRLRLARRRPQATLRRRLDALGRSIQHCIGGLTLMRGYIRRRGAKGSFELTLELDAGADGKRRRRFANVKGSHRDAQRALAKMLAEADAGSLCRSVEDDARRLHASSRSTQLTSWRRRQESVTPRSLLGGLPRTSRRRWLRPPRDRDHGCFPVCRVSRRPMAALRAEDAPANTPTDKEAPRQGCARRPGPVKAGNARGRGD